MQGKIQIHRQPIYLISFFTDACKGEVFDVKIVHIKEEELSDDDEVVPEEIPEQQKKKVSTLLIDTIGLVLFAFIYFIQKQNISNILLQALPPERIELLQKAEAEGKAVSYVTGAISQTDTWEPISRSKKVGLVPFKKFRFFASLLMPL